MAEQRWALAVFLWLCTGCGLSASEEPQEQADEPGPVSSSPQTPTASTASASPSVPSGQPPQAPTTIPPAQVPAEPAASAREPTCGVDWNNGRAFVPSASGVVGTFNGRPFALTLDEVHVELDCERAANQPPPIHIGFTLDEEGMVFVIRRCDGIAYLPDDAGVALETDLETTVGTINQASDGPSGGHFRLTGRQSPETELLELEFTLSVPFVAANPLPLCPG